MRLYTEHQRIWMNKTSEETGRSRNHNDTHKKKIQHWQQVSAFLAAYDAVAVTMAYFLALLLRFDFTFSAIPLVYLRPWEVFAPLYIVICLIIFRSLKLYRSIWRFASFTELVRITQACIITTLLHIVGVTAIINILASDTNYNLTRMPFSYYIIGAVTQFVLLVAVRFSYRFVLLMRAARSHKEASKVMLVGLYSIIKAT